MAVELKSGLNPKPGPKLPILRKRTKIRTKKTPEILSDGETNPIAGQVKKSNKPNVRPQFVVNWRIFSFIRRGIGILRLLAITQGEGILTFFSNLMVKFLIGNEDTGAFGEIGSFRMTFGTNPNVSHRLPGF